MAPTAAAPHRLPNLGFSVQAALLGGDGLPSGPKLGVGMDPGAGAGTVWPPDGRLLGSVTNTTCTHGMNRKVVSPSDNTLTRAAGSAAC